MELTDEFSYVAEHLPLAATDQFAAAHDCPESCEQDSRSHFLQLGQVCSDVESEPEYTDNEHDTDDDLSEELEEDSEENEDLSTKRLMHKYRLARVTEVEEEEMDSTDESDIMEDDDEDDDQDVFDEQVQYKMPLVFLGGTVNEKMPRCCDSDGMCDALRRKKLQALCVIHSHSSKAALDRASNQKEDGFQTETQFLRLEKMRAELEQDLGVELLLKAYNIIQALQEDEEEDVTASEKAVVSLLGEEKATKYYERILQLVLADGAFMDGASTILEYHGTYCAPYQYELQ
ncbi:unnamed protein product [Echinostoma caproni]|uniref:LisH domain-containing protein n=1 Tax=Echinostoma caproni TaxID=27848 RepID=A0A183BB90_9TREM|nr:unnamed protein product [Echinostoma caproni]